jgi:hypothetical protein
MLTRKAKLLLSLTAATPLLFAACVDNSLIGPYGDVAGTYQLTVFAGATPPITFTYPPGQFNVIPNGGTITWTDGTMELHSNGTFTERDNYSYRDNQGATGTSVYVSSGTFTVNGAAFSLSTSAQQGGRFATGTIGVDRINYNEDNGDGTTSAFEYIR